jgi:hypothetical protein
MKIRLTFFATLAITFFSLISCGGTTPVAKRPDAANCKITLSGAISGTATCAAIGGSNSITNQSSVSITATAPIAGAMTATITMAFDGGMKAATFSDLNTTQYGAIVTEPTNAGQAPNVWAVSPNPKQGSISLTINSSSVYVGSGGATAYFVHGTATATLQPQAASGAVGTVTLTATF